MLALRLLDGAACLAPVVGQLIFRVSKPRACFVRVGTLSTVGVRVPRCRGYSVELSRQGFETRILVT